jgi:hypothetical protein
VVRLPQAATTSPAATITAVADNREQLRSMRTSPLLTCAATSPLLSSCGQTSIMARGVGRRWSVGT